MNFLSHSLHIVEPETERFSRRLREVVVYAVRVYWDLFVSLPVTLLSMALAAMMVVVGFLDLAHHPERLWSEVPLVSLAAAFLVWARCRAFVWAWLACSIGWLVVISLILLPFLGPAYQVTTWAERILLGSVYLLPPLLGALYIDRVRHARG